MARKQSALVNWSQYLTMRAVFGVMHCLSVEQNLHNAALLGSALFHARGNSRARAMRHVKLCYPEWSDQRALDVAERSLQHMVQMFLVDAVIMPRIVNESSWPNYLALGEVHRPVHHLVHRRPAIFLAAHVGNWELLGYFLSLLRFPIAALARPIDNPLVNDWLLGVRQARGMRIITKWGAMHETRRILEERGQIAIIGDQNAGDGGLFVPFFGHLASSYKSISLMAMRFGVPVIAGLAERIGGGFRYELQCPDFISPDEWIDQPDPLFYLTARYNRAIEMMVRQVPEQYLWVHRRWKSRPKHEMECEPMPGKLIAKIESLPWMTQEERDRIIANAAEALERRKRGEMMY